MKAQLQPEHFKVSDPESKANNFSDAWGLTCAQLGATLTELLKINPHAQIRREDLAGYHYAQYGMATDLTNETIDAAQRGTWHGWDLAQPLQTALPRILGVRTVGAIVERLLLGAPDEASELELDPELDDYLYRESDLDPNRNEVIGLYPRVEEGASLTYVGRSTLNLGEVTIKHFIQDLSVYSDILVASSTDLPDKTIVVTSDSQSHHAPIKKVEVF